MKGFIILLTLILTTQLVYPADQADYPPEQLPGLINDFTITSQMLDEYKVPLAGPIDAVATIRLSREIPAEKETYFMTFYLDKSFVFNRESVALPYDFTWNFKGLSQGKHELYFVFKDPQGKLGVLRLDLDVQHKK